MTQYRGLEKPLATDWQGLVDNIRRKGTPRRVFHLELFHDGEFRYALAERFNLLKGVAKDDPDRTRRTLIAVNRFCGFDAVTVGLVGINLQFNQVVAEDTAEFKRTGGRSYINEHTGPITNWEQFEKYKWPDPSAPAATRDLEWYQKNLPQDMCIIGGLTGHIVEEITFLMGYETLCFALFENRDLVAAIAKKINEYYRIIVGRMLQFDRVKMIWASDDMGYKTGLMISPADMREFVLPSHKMLARMTHDAGRPYLLHACGKLTEIIDDLTDDVKIDAKHSFEDTIEDVRAAKTTYGRKVALIGGMDVDFLCRSDEAAIRKRVRETLDVCQAGGGYCLGTGNSVANYVPMDNYLAMIDEGRLYAS